MKERYVVTPPVSAGYNWWDVNDLQDNQTLASIRADVPGAEALAGTIRDALIAANGNRAVADERDLGHRV